LVNWFGDYGTLAGEELLEEQFSLGGDFILPVDFKDEIPDWSLQSMRSEVNARLLECLGQYVWSAGVGLNISSSYEAYYLSAIRSLNFCEDEADDLVAWFCDKKRKMIRKKPAMHHSPYP